MKHRSKIKAKTSISYIEAYTVAIEHGEYKYCVKFKDNNINVHRYVERVYDVKNNITTSNAKHEQNLIQKTVYLQAHEFGSGKFCAA